MRQLLAAYSIAVILIAAFVVVIGTFGGNNHQMVGDNVE